MPISLKTNYFENFAQTSSATAYPFVAQLLYNIVYLPLNKPSADGSQPTSTSQTSCIPDHLQWLSLEFRLIRSSQISSCPPSCTDMYLPQVKPQAPVQQGNENSSIFLECLDVSLAQQMTKVNYES